MILALYGLVVLIRKTMSSDKDKKWFDEQYRYINRSIYYNNPIFPSTYDGEYYEDELSKIENMLFFDKSIQNEFDSMYGYDWLSSPMFIKWAERDKYISEKDSTTLSNFSRLLNNMPFSLEGELNKLYLSKLKIIVRIAIVLSNCLNLESEDLEKLLDSDLVYESTSYTPNKCLGCPEDSKGWSAFYKYFNWDNRNIILFQSSLDHKKYSTTFDNKDNCTTNCKYTLTGFKFFENILDLSEQELLDLFNEIVNVTNECKSKYKGRYMPAEVYM
jgi:hypothetical protein